MASWQLVPKSGAEWLGIIAANGEKNVAQVRAFIERGVPDKDRPARSMARGGSSAGGGTSLAAVGMFIELDLEVPGAWGVL